MTCDCIPSQTQLQIERRPLAETFDARGLEPCLRLLSQCRAMIRLDSLEGFVLAVRAIQRAETAAGSNHAKLHRSIRAARVRLEMRRETPDFLALVKIIHIRREHAQ